MNKGLKEKIISSITTQYETEKFYKLIKKSFDFQKTIYPFSI